MLALLQRYIKMMPLETLPPACARAPPPPGPGRRGRRWRSRRWLLGGWEETSQQLDEVGGVEEGVGRVLVFGCICVFRISCLEPHSISVPIKKNSKHAGTSPRAYKFSTKMDLVRKIKNSENLDSRIFHVQFLKAVELHQ